MTPLARYCEGMKELYTERLHTPLVAALFGTGVVASGEMKMRPPPGAVPLLTPVTRMVAGSQVKPLVFEPPTSR